jgi:hypothetical protein
MWMRSLSEFLGNKLPSSGEIAKRRHSAICENTLTMYVYADQNFLIRCRDTSDGKDLIIPAHKSGKATLVLSPMHFYEIGTVRQDLCDSTIQFVDDAQPSWILERFDLLLHEFLSEWTRFWKKKPFNFSPIGDLAHAASAIHRKPRELFAGLTSRDFIEPFRDQTALQEMRDTFKMNLHAHAENSSKYVAGVITSEMLRQVEKRYVATQLARVSEKGPLQKELHERANYLLKSEPSFSEISIFVENGAVDRLKAHKVEVLMTSDRWQGEAVMKENRQIDREHAIVALAYCDVFVTGDSELRKYCEQVKVNSRFTLAKIVSIDEWIETLRKM